MKDFRIYTCGKMTGLCYGQQMVWRKKIETCIKELYKAKHGTFANIAVINPPQYFSTEDLEDHTEEEIMQWELEQVCKADVVVVNLEGITESIGSHFELGAVFGANITSDKRTKIIAIGDIPTRLHPWINLCWFKHFKDAEAASRYIVDYLLI